MKEDMKEARNMPDAAFGSQANLEAVAPQSGQWTSTYVEERKTKQSTYNISFAPHGQISGNGQDDDGEFDIVHGVYNVNTRRIMWLEMGSEWNAEMSLEYDENDPSCLKGNFIADNLV